MNVFELFAKLSLDTSEYDNGLDDAKSKGESFSSGFGSALKAGGAIAVGALALTTTAVVGVTTAFGQGIAETAAYGDQIDKMSQKLGMTTDAYQEWDAVMQHCGTSIDVMKSGMKTLASAAETDSEYFEQLGMSQEEIANMSQEELFGATITALQNVEDDTQRTYLASKLLGKGASELGALLNLSAEETQAMKDKVHELGGVMSEDAVKASAAYTDSLQDMTTAFSGLKNNLMSEFLPAVTTVMDGISMIVTGDSEGGLALISEGVNDFVSNLNTELPKFMEVGAGILDSIITAITQNLPTLIESGQEVLSNLISGLVSNLPALLQSAFMLIKTMANALLENLPQIASVALELIIELANGLSEYLPVLLPALTAIIKDIVVTLTQPDMLSMLISAALQLILALGDGLVRAIPDLISVIPILYANIIVTLVDMFPEILNAVLMLLGELGMAVFGVVAGLLGMNYDEMMNYLTLALDFLGSWGGDLINNLVAWFADVSKQFTDFATNAWNNVVNFFTNIYNKWINWEVSVISGVVGFFSDIANNINNGLSDALSFVTDFGTDLWNSLMDIWDNAVSIVSDGVNNLIGLLGFDWELPDLKLPHFSITGSLDLLATPPTYPTVSVDWYKKGYSDAYILNGATIFGAQGGSLLGGGEGSGGEVVVGTSKLMDMMSEAVSKALGGGQTIVIPVYIGNEKLDELVVKSNQRNDYISGGR